MESSYLASALGIEATAEDAKYTAEANHSDKKGWSYGSGRSGWYSKHTPGGYAN